MEDRKQVNVAEPGLRPGAAIATDGAEAAENHAPRTMTLSQNMMLTVKILVIGGAVIALIWGIDQWSAG